MKLLMVCLGNICRSPLAHGVLEHMVKERGLDWEIDSAGTGDWHVGEAPDKRSIAIAKKYGVDISNQCCRIFRVADFDDYDRIYVMDKNNLLDVLSLARSDQDRTKVTLFLGTGTVPDPYYDNDQFEPVYKMIEKRCRELIEEATQIS
ncbi:MAG TPA: low molecular weight protein-tyrosine-phosphatase [Sphingobacteriaceae bacterium]